MNLIIEILVVIVTSRIAWSLWKSYRNYHIIHRMLKREILLIEKNYGFGKANRTDNFNY